MSNDSKNKKESEQHKINPNTYRWTYHAMNTLFKVFNLTIRVNGNKSAWQHGNIFLFNHFARFESLIPQFLIYKETGLYSRSIASKELFADNVFGRYLSELGGIPNDADKLMYLVSKDILQQQKLVAFPEGGIVKDRQILDNKGRYRIYSRSRNERRKLHTGPAVMALAIAIFKQAVRDIHKQADHKLLSKWAQELGYKSTQELVLACQQPTVIIPCNITFYPLRISDNALKKSVQFFVDNLHQRLSEELLIEGNFLLKNTDMDIHLGEPIIAEDYWTKLESAITTAFVKKPDLVLSEIFNNVQNDDTWDGFLFRLSYQRNAHKIRDDYMHAIYDNTTINIAHIAATLIIHFVEEGKTHINKRKLHHLIYCTIKILQKETKLNFHKTLKNPSIYRNLLMTKSNTFDQFLRGAYKAKLLESSGIYYNFKENITSTNDFDSIRLKNPIAVYANEVASIPALQKAIKNSLAFRFNKKLDAFAKMRFEDEILEYHWDLAQFKEEKHQQINRKQSISEQSALPYILKPENHNGQCVVLIHGLLSSPAELKRLGDKLYKLNYIVIGCRLKGHGTSPWDLHERTWQDWQQSVRQSIKIAHCYTKYIHLVGFSSGSLLALMVAANRNLHISSVTACSTPVIFKDPLIPFTTATHLTNKIIKKLSGSEGILPFKDNDPEHPHINYHHTPIAAIHQLLILIKKTTARLKKIKCPTLFMQGDNDPVIDSSSMAKLSKHIPKSLLNLHWVNSNRHGILHENTENCQQKVIDFINAQNK
ncbi:MAG: acyltransferase [Cycloclasticus sp. symbiont of Poecilosclerida sp. N]|nr:MAG: acyltransferase [Cycloclasticus sp. symbiont of Poecilosclerida sp. N]